MYWESEGKWGILMAHPSISPEETQQASQGFEHVQYTIHGLTSITGYRLPMFRQHQNKTGQP